jgi:DNA topoisomerase-3
MLGILTEKPSAGRNFAKALGGESGTFDGVDYVIVSARGHLYEWADISDMVNGEELKTKYKSWDVNHLPWNNSEIHWKRKSRGDVAGTLQTIKTTLSKCTEIAIATDVDPTGEGDLLACEILQELKLDRTPLSRFYFIDESEKEIQKAFRNRKGIPSIDTFPEYVKALYRSKFDFLTMQFTRIALSASDGSSVLRQGRLKSAMVVLTGDGLKAVREYKKIPFYQNKFKDENGNIYTNSSEPSFPDKSQVPQSYGPSAVYKEGVERKTTAPRKLLDLASLAAILAPKGFKSKEVLDTYQKLYEAQIVSYPRTEDKKISPEQFNELLPLVDSIARVVGVANNLLTHREPRSTHVKTGGAHGANRPGLKVPNDLASLASYGKSAPQIYELLAKSYLAMLAEDYEYDLEKGFVQEYPDFKGSVSIPVSLGWKQVFGATESGDDDDDTNPNAMHLGTQASPFIHEGFPPKPPQPSMKWLMTQLGKHDVGTGATRTSTYAEVTREQSDKNKYPLLVDTKGKLTMTEFGEKSYKILPGTKIGSIELTEELQKDMRDIAAGQANPEQLLKKVADYVVSDLAVMFENGKDIVKTRPTPKPKFTGVWSETGTEVSFAREWSGYAFSDDECAQLLSGEIIPLIGVISKKTGKPYNTKGKLVSGVYNGKNYVGFQAIWDIPESFLEHKFTESEVDQLRAGTTISVNDLISSKTGKPFSANLTWKDSKLNMTFPFPETFNGHTFTEPEVEQLLAGKKLKCDDLISGKTGKPYSAELKWDAKESKIVMEFEKRGIPASWSGHTFTPDEIKLLEGGKTVVASDFISAKTGKPYMAEVKWDKKGSKLDLKFPEKKK